MPTVVSSTAQDQSSINLLDRGGSLASHENPSYELDLLNKPEPASEPQTLTDRERRQQEKRDFKRAWLEEQDEMKFSHSIQFNAVPDWSSHYIAYSNLKKLLVHQNE